MSISINGKITQVSEMKEFEAKVLNNVTLPAENRAELVAFQKKVSELNRNVRAAVEISNDIKNKLETIRTVLLRTENVSVSLFEDISRILLENKNLYRKLTGDEVIANRNEPTYPSISDRLGEVIYGMWQTSSVPTKAYLDNYQIASDEFKLVAQSLKKLNDVDVKNLENELDKLNAPWTPGRPLKID
jgi:hypothetical protein